MKQENLNPEIEEKLLQLQRYQEKQMKGTDGTMTSVPSHSTPITSISRTPARKRPMQTPTSLTMATTQSGTGDKNSDWMLETPKRRPPIKQETRDVSK